MIFVGFMPSSKYEELRSRDYKLENGLHRNFVPAGTKVVDFDRSKINTNAAHKRQSQVNFVTIVPSKTDVAAPRTVRKVIRRCLNNPILSLSAVTLP